MTARLALKLSSLTVAIAAAACTSFYEVSIETPIRPTLDVSAFDRVLVAGFIAGGSDDIDANIETTRLLRSQLRTQSRLQVLDAEVLALTEVAARSLLESGAETLPESVAAAVRRKSATRRTSSRTRRSSPTPSTGASSARSTRTRSSSLGRSCSRPTPEAA